MPYPKTCMHVCPTPNPVLYCGAPQVSVCPANVITGYTLFVEDEDKDVNAIVTRADMEAHMVVHLAGRCAEKLVMGESEVTGRGAGGRLHGRGLGGLGGLGGWSPGRGA